MLLIGRIVQSSSLNSFSSICYCFFTLGVHAYSCYTAVGRYREAESRAWPGGGGRSGPPVESGTMLGLTILSLVLMPLFCFTCVLKVGNLANDGVKLGRDHALGCASDTTKDCSTRSRGLRRLWKIACPISQTIHLIAAFLILLPETLLTAVEIKYGYKSTELAALNRNFGMTLGDSSNVRLSLGNLFPKGERVSCTFPLVISHRNLPSPRRQPHRCFLPICRWTTFNRAICEMCHRRLFQGEATLFVDEYVAGKRLNRLTFLELREEPSVYRGPWRGRVSFQATQYTRRELSLVAALLMEVWSRSKWIRQTPFSHGSSSYHRAEL
ncbi:hypothetical protein RRG08_026167 [Elysia crispata]|uniref:Uncharacterized protein n=1 Tax=Elysia crispata TaxID=231223 RepID=A0AAE1DCQ3_9GAST|nr:hypothetical protein RRG08_026167 [Elysia crispata]